MYVKSIKSNAKRGANADLGRLTLIVGPNGSGKSSIVNAVELALTGRASDVVGRAEVAKGIELLTLAPADADALWANALLSDGRSVEWRCERNAKTGGAREATHTLPSDVKPVFPVRQVREALTGSPGTVRAWLVGRIGAAVSEAAIMGLFPEDLRSAYSDLCRPLFGTPAQILLDAREAAGKQARNANADAKAATSLAEQTGAGLGIEPTDADVDAARQRVRAAAVVAATASRPPVNAAALRAVAEEAVALFQQRSDEAQQIRDAVAALPAVNADVVRTRDALTRVLTFTASNHAADCLICTNPIPFGAHATMLQRAEGLAAAAQGDVRGEELRSLLARAEAALPALRDTAQRAVLAYRDAADAPASDGDPVGATNALRAAEEEVRRLEGARAAWEGVRAAQARSRDAKGRARLYADLHDAIEDAIGRVLERACADFVKKVQSFLPIEDAFNLVLSEGGKDVCRFGFMRDGVLHTALSGAEWARLTLALAAAVASDDEADIAVLTPEDRAFDPETLRAVMDGLGNAPGQVLLCSPVHPAGRTPKGWTVIDLSPAKPKRTAKAAPTASAADTAPDEEEAKPDGRADLDVFFNGNPGEAK